MPNYRYKALDETGRTRSGTLEAGRSEEVAALLMQRGFMLEEISEVKGKGTGSAAGWRMLLQPRVRMVDQILFSKQLRTLLRAGVAIMEALKILQSQSENRILKTIIGQLAADIEAGSSFHEALRRHPRVFPSLYVSMVQAGETSGALPDVLDRLIYIIEHEHKVKSDIKGALQYPIIVILFLFVAFFVLLTFVVPKFVQIFIRAGIAVPLPTKICMLLYDFLVGYWPLIGIGLAGALTALTFFLRTEQGRYVRDSILLNMVFVGPLFVKSAMSRFASIFAILHASGIKVLDSMRILSGAIGNAVISREFKKVQERLEQGHGIAGPLRQARYFTPMVVNMVAVGEESGRLDEMLREVSAHYDDEVEFATKRLSEAIGPMLTIGLAAVVCFFALAIFLPMWDLTQLVKAH